MTYEEFKKELRWNVQNMETARGKTIRLLERHMVCGDPMAVHIMNIMNRCMYGREQIMIREDMLCALWMRGKREYIQHWPIRPKPLIPTFVIIISSLILRESKFCTNVLSNKLIL